MKWPLLRERPFLLKTGIALDVSLHMIKKHAYLIDKISN